MRGSRLLLPVFAAAALVLGACSDNSVSGSGTGKLRVQLTDAPGDLKSAFVKIDKIVLLRSDADSTATDSTRRVEITPNVTGYIDLLKLSGGKLLDLVQGATVPEGSYSQVRVVLDEAYVTLTDGRLFATSGAEVPAGSTIAGTLKCPSCAQSGFKVFFPSGGLNVVGNSTVVIDFDAGQSFGHEAGKSGQWIMHPVLRANATTIRFANITGTVSLAQGVTLPACGGQANTLTVFKPLAVLSPDTLSGNVDANGAFTIANILPGTYTLSYAKDITYTNGDSLTITATPSVASLAIAQADSAHANYSVTAATCH